MLSVCTCPVLGYFTEIPRDARDNSHEMKLSLSHFTLYKKDKVLDTNNLGRGENSNWLTGLIFIHNWLPDFKAGNTSHWISMHPAEVLG